MESKWAETPYGEEEHSVLIPLQEVQEDIVTIEHKGLNKSMSVSVANLLELSNQDDMQGLPKVGCSLEVDGKKESTLISARVMKQLSYFLILVAMLSIASGGVAFKMFPRDVTPLLGCAWRAQATMVCLIPFLVLEVRKMPSDQRDKLKSYKLWGSILYCGVATTMWSGTFAVALQFTSLTKVYLLNNSQPILLVLWDKITGKQVKISQTVGVILGMVGLVLTVYDKTLLEASTREIAGDAIAVLGAVFAAMYLSVGTSIRSSVPGTFTFLVPMWFVSLLMFSAGSVIFEGSSFYQLTIGWYNADRYWIVLWLAIVTGVVGISTVIIVMKYLCPLTIAVVLLCEPIAASLFAVAIGVETLPQPITWVGAAVVTAGVVCVTIDFQGILNYLLTLQKLNKSTRK